ASGVRLSAQVAGRRRAPLGQSLRPALRNALRRHEVRAPHAAHDARGRGAHHGGNAFAAAGEGGSGRLSTPNFPPVRGSPFGVVAPLRPSQTLAWASSYYLPAILADPMAADIGVSRALVFGAFSGSLLIAAVVGPAVGRAIDRRGGRGVLVWSNLVLAAGLCALAVS